MASAPGDAHHRLQAADVARAAWRLAAKGATEVDLVESLARELDVEPSTVRAYFESLEGPPQAVPRLDRDRVVSAAITIADEQGPGELTLRRVATELGVTPMALYRYVDSKDALLDAMIDHVFAAVTFDVPEDASWQQEIRTLLHGLRDAIAPHPGVATLMVTRPVALGEHAARLRNIVIGALRTAGLSPREAFDLFDVVVNVAAALLLRDASLASDGNYMVASRQERLARLQEEVASYEAGAFPHLAEAIEFWAEPPDPTAEFDRALAMLISGLEAEVEAVRGFDVSP